MSALRRALLGGLVAVSAIAALPATSAPAATSSAFAATWAAYPPYSDASGCRGLDATTTDAWCDAQLEVTVGLAEAPASNLVEFEVKLAAGLCWFNHSDASSNLCSEEADLLRSCLTDLWAIMAKGA